MLLVVLVYLSFEKNRWSSRQERPMKKKPKRRKKETVKARVFGAVEPYYGSQASYASIYTHGILRA